ncbi:hypothetical protein ACSBL2_13630 [Pedobacter sp. AW31-3R]|uniref:hypothetical protein n=1 Tax=Pedobacter sp. AW31-3R TaxID=3445781 RepID=UPI003FA1285A
MCLLATGGLYYYHLQSSSLYWSPVVTYSTLGALLLVTVYDLVRSRLSTDFRRQAAIYEHVYKMISAMSGLASAFAGTVLPQYHPYSQFLPSVLGLCWIVVIFISLNHASKAQKKQVVRKTLSTDYASRH